MVAIKPLGFIIIFLITTVLAIGVLVPIIADKAEEIDSANSIGTASFLGNFSGNTTLTPTGEGITSLTATAKNQTWLSFDGVNDGLNILRTMETTEINNFTLSIWINTSDNSKGILYELTSSFNGYIYNGLINITSRNQTLIPVQEFQHTSLINDSQWHNIIISQHRNNTSINSSIFVDNCINSSVLQSNFPRFGSFSDVDFFGSSNGRPELFGDEIRWYNRSLTQSEITQIYNSGRVANSSLPTTGLVLWLPLNEGTGTDVHSLNQGDFT